MAATSSLLSAMAQELLLPSQRNDVFTRVVSAGLRPGEFEWTEWASDVVNNLTVNALTHELSEDYWFQFDRNSRGEHIAVFAPGSETHKEMRSPGSWENQLGYVDQWLVYLRREIEAPDLWSDVASSPGIDVGTSNAPFTPTELAAIAERLTQIEARVKEVKALQEGEARYVHETLDYLKTTAKTEGRRNWINMAIGVIFNIVLFLGLPPEHAGSLFRFGVENLQGLGLGMGGVPPTMPGPTPLPGPPPASRR